eukprot:CAMPEP_0171898452 /NCGR_PEP_ID=MMETSP0992-20121227/48731_1 /TAXON_ID=483369 /ORGANISM="non described non described, Strain CCMP2098" /LENGTH=114 /DNA_ID=CAMNT_0012526757 /DNA_START=220 /DNA_END=564 /DNA_ORIENTATION=+
MSRKTKAIRQFLLLSQPKQQHKQPLQSPPPQQQSWQQPWQQSWQVQNGMPQQLQSELGCIVDPTATAAPTPTTANASTSSKFYSQANCYSPLPALRLGLRPESGTGWAIPVEHQ